MRAFAMAASCVALKRTLRSDAAIGSFSTRESPVIGWSNARRRAENVTERQFLERSRQALTS